MRFLKVSCIKCSHYKECPQITRLYVNYCGADCKRVENKIQDATEDCRARRGLLAKYTFLPVVSLSSPLQNAIGNARG